MKRFKSLFIALGVFLISLTACSGGGIEGKYVFQMGSTTGTNAKAEAELLKLTPNPDKGINVGDFHIKLSIQNNAGESTNIAIDGIYNIGESKYNDRGTRLELNIQDFIYQETRIPIDIDPSYLDLLILSYVKGKEFSLIVPVSIEDLTYQLAWYTLDKNNVETHPTAEQIAQLREGAYPGQIVPLPNYRDWHTVNIGLIKE